MKLEYIFIKKKDDFCQNEDQFKNYLSTNIQIAFIDNVLEVNKKKFEYKIGMFEVPESKEIGFRMTIIANQGQESEQVIALESVDTIITRINDKINIFQINTIWDDVSMYYGRKLYPAITEVESLLRQIIYIFMLEKVGINWIKEQTPGEVKKEIDNTKQKNKIDDFSNSNALMYTDFKTLGWFLFEKYPLKSDFQKLIRQLRDEKNIDRKKLVELLELYEFKSNWDRYFADAIQVDDLENKWKKLYEYRNKVAHTKKIVKKEFDNASNIITEVKNAFIASIEHIKSIDMTAEEMDAVEEVVEQIITPSSKPVSTRYTLFDLYDNKDIIIDNLRTVMTKLSEYTKTVAEKTQYLQNVSHEIYSNDMKKSIEAMNKGL